MHAIQFFGKSNTLNNTSNITDSDFAMFKKRLEQLNRTFHH